MRGRLTKAAFVSDMKDSKDIKDNKKDHINAGINGEVIHNRDTIVTNDAISTINEMSSAIKLRAGTITSPLLSSMSSITVRPINSLSLLLSSWTTLR